MLSDDELIHEFDKGGREKALLLVLLDIRSELREMNSRASDNEVPTFQKAVKKK